jgi:hypothetical protein
LIQRYIHGKSISTYPHLPDKPQRDGEPICDSFSIQVFEDDVVLACVTDGCNWGKRPMMASNTARASFLEYMRGKLNDVSGLIYFLLFIICRYA